MCQAFNDRPAIGLVTLTELVDHVAAIADAVDIPILADADTGFGNPINTARTVKLLERAGAAGIQIEDQVFPRNVDISPASRSYRPV
jgi:2-methylisocitrate lyase-like PEP mutase family enzyme